MGTVAGVRWRPVAVAATGVLVMAAVPLAGSVAAAQASAGLACKTLSVSIADARVTEGTGPGATTASFTVSATGCAAKAVTLNYHTVDGSAVAPHDYRETVGRLTWLAGDSSDRTIMVRVIRDPIVEPNECFAVRLTGPRGRVRSVDGNAVGTIINDDGGGGARSGSAHVVVPNGGRIGWKRCAKPGHAS